MKTSSSFNRGNVYESITAEIIRAIEAGVGEFRMPWHRGAQSGLPQNAATKNRYHGLNTLALWSTSLLRGYTSPAWATYRQWSALGAQVRKGERSSPILFYQKRDLGEEEVVNDDGDTPRAIVRRSSVFNANQVDGWESGEELPEDRTDRLEAVDAFIASLGADILYGGDRASYSPAYDRISMPERRQFIGTETSSATESFYSVLLHEHVHWTGHTKRLARDLSGRFGTSAYAMEELVAEIGTAYLCADLGISLEPRLDHAAYVKSWLAVLADHPSALVSASSAAMVACRYMGEVSG